MYLETATPDKPQKTMVQDLSMSFSLTSKHVPIDKYITGSALRTLVSEK